MANTKISALTSATTPLAGTETLPVVQSGATTKVTVANLTAGRDVSTAALTSTTASAAVIATFTRTSTSISAYVVNGGTSANFSSDTSANNAFSAIPGTNAAAIVTNGTTKVVVASGGDVTLNVGNLVPSTAAKGVNFTANTPKAGMTSQLLNWYEEGTFTPTLVGTTTNPTVTYGLQRALYTRIGRVVTVTCYMTWSAFSGGSGNVAVGSLPFTVESGTGAYGGGAISGFDGFTLAAARTSVAIQPQPGTTYATPTCFGSAVSTQYIPTSSVAASGNIVFTLTYFV